MSIKCMNWAWSLPLKPTAKLVLMSLSDIANDLGECFPSIRYVADRCCISKRHTRRVIKKLVELKLLEAQTRLRKDDSNTSNLYILAIPKPRDDNLSPPLLKSIQSCQEGVTYTPGGSDTQTLPLTTIEPPIKQTTTTTEKKTINWPAKLADTDKKSIEKLVVGLPSDDIQELLDELGGQLKNIKRPVSYFHALLKKHEKGLFFPSSSTQVKSGREVKQNTEASLRNAKKLNIERLRSYGIQIDDEP